MTMKIRFAAVCAIASALAGCAGSGGYRATAKENTKPAYTEVERAVPQCAPTEAKFDCDRRAILAMLGEYKVSFRFDETAVLAPGYVRKPEQRSGGFETVVLIADEGQRIDLQHILVVGGGHVVKHWRQTWVYQADPIWSFEGGQHYRAKDRDDAAVPGTWTQFVYEVSDAPRYAGSGRWNHNYGVSTWTSDRTWRPLPRREYTKRDDYQLLNVENRHTITPQGWTHEQDNTKVQRTEDGRDRTLVREFGFNDYRRIDGYDFSPGYAYWKKTAAFWAAVRERWAQRLAEPQGLTLGYPTDDEKFITAMFEAAEAFADNQDMGVASATIDSLFVASVLASEPAQRSSDSADVPSRGNSSTAN
jgi:hypothetical protein